MAGRAAPRGRKRTTITDVAERAGVSVPTVSRVLSGNYPVATATRAKVLRAVRELDYVANAHARALAGATTKTVAFVVHDITWPFFAHIAQGVEEQARQEGRMCLVCTTQGDPERELEAVEQMREQHADAVILVGGGFEAEENRQRLVHFARLLDEAGSRLVLCGRPSPGDDVPATIVEYDNAGGAFAMTSHLLSLGHRRIAFLGVRPGFTTVVERVEGYRRAHETFRVTPDPTLLREGDFLRSYGYEATRELLAERTDVTAIFAVTDVVAAGVLHALRDSGVRVPEEMSVVGYDDIPMTMELTPALTTVHIPHEELGRTAVRLALHRHESTVPQHVVLGTHIAVRDSVAPPPM
ncbi:LacI family DNA-binding transcriptional regulator [Phytoactinopolyspora halotolerans]|uniref:LacI family transcriptional regulator n=1 Tax=Phytoactinopolyspora halotolerans TaxID=1981512 RepID=A0A6L9SCG8_9ACTN|nr:LacI family DNA-binding transcriptional regulator [Phytoactinopolyspora halotolerans]NEE02709.1 LacI family transcriptional regulator [Phytoactinopolyspora halotolerans]